MIENMLEFRYKIIRQYREIAHYYLHLLATILMEMRKIKRAVDKRKFA